MAIHIFTGDNMTLGDYTTAVTEAIRDWVLTKLGLKYDKTGGEITGNVKVDGSFTLDIEDEDYDAGITFTKSLDNNAGTILTMTGYANTNGSNTTYRPKIRNIGDPVSNYDVANKQYVDSHVVRPLSYLVFLNNDGTIDTMSSQLSYATVKANLTNMTTNVYLDVIQGTSRFYVQAMQDMDVNNGPIKFLGWYSKDGNIVEIEFELYSDDSITHSIRVVEHTGNKVQSVTANSLSASAYPSAAAVFNEFQRKPVVIWEVTDTSQGLNALQSNISASGVAWQLTGLDFSPYKRIKIYSKGGQGSTNAGTTGGMILEMSLDPRMAITTQGGHYVGSVLVQKPNDSNRYASLTCAVSADKTSFAVLRQTSLYGTAATTNNDIGASVVLIEGYYD